MEMIDARRLLGLDPAFRLSTADISFSIASDGTAVLSAASADLLLTVLAPGDLAGSYALSPLEFDGGPVALRAPEIAGAPMQGSALQVRPALWAYDGGASEPVRSWQWQRDGSDIPGATAQAFVPGPAEAGAVVRVVETAIGVNGTRSSASSEVVIPA